VSDDLKQLARQGGIGGTDAQSILDALLAEEALFMNPQAAEQMQEALRLLDTGCDAPERNG